MGDFIKHVECPDCGGSDCLALHEEEDGTYNGTCWSECRTDSKNGYKSHNTLARSYLGPELGIEPISRGRKKSKLAAKSEREDKPVSRSKKTKESKTLTERERQRVEDNSSTKGTDFRGIKDKWLKYYGVRTAYDEETGEASNRYYPVTKTKDEDTKLVGYKDRVVETKNFYAVGKNSKDCDMFGQFRCKGKGKIVINGGEEDTLAAKQMFEDYRRSRGEDKIAPVDFVSSSVGETSCAEQIRHNYEFFDRYELIILDMDADTPGENAVKKILDVLPIAKVRVMSYNTKDANAALDEGLDKDYIRSIYTATKPKIAGVLGGLELFQAALESASAELIPLPEELKPLQDKLCGGLPMGEITNILAASGVGKTTITNLLLKFWIFNSPYKVGICSLEAGSGKFAMRLFSIYLGENIARLETPEEKVQFLEDNAERLKPLMLDKNGEERFSVVDDKGEFDSLTEAKRVIERMIRQSECKVIIIDPIQDLLDTLAIEDQAAFIGWQKKIKARDGVAFININHTRKSGGGSKAGSQGGELTEEDMQGTSSIYKSGAVNIVITRNKTAECEEDRNTTSIKLTKSRDVGDTGPAGELYYEFKTATLYNKEDWVNENY